jgi:hypothetical protein
MNCLDRNEPAMTMPTVPRFPIRLANRCRLGRQVLLLFLGLLGVPSFAQEWFWTGDGNDGRSASHTFRGGTAQVSGMAMARPASLEINDFRGGLDLYGFEAVRRHTGSRLNWAVKLASSDRYSTVGQVMIERPASLPALPPQGISGSFDIKARGTADGFSFNFGAVGSGTPSGEVENGYGGGLSIAFPWFRQSRMKVLWRGAELANEDIGSVEICESDNIFGEHHSRVQFSVTPEADGKARLKVTYDRVSKNGSVTTKGKEFETPITFNPQSTWAFAFGARNGAESSTIYLDRIRLNAVYEPNLGDIPNSESEEGRKYSRQLSFSAGGGTASFQATSDDPSLLGPITVTPSGELVFSPAAGKSGSATVTVNLSSGGKTLSRTFVHTVRDIDYPPTLQEITDKSVKMNKEGGLVVPLSGIGPGAGDQQSVTITAKSSNTAVIPDPTVEYSSPNSFGSLRITSLKNQSGDARITVTVQDQAGLSLQRTFTVRVGAPSFRISGASRGATITGGFSFKADRSGVVDLRQVSRVTLDEDSGPVTVQITDIDDGDPESEQAITFSHTSSIPGLVPTGTHQAKGTTAIDLVLTPTPNANSAVFGNQPAVIKAEIVNADGAKYTASFEVLVNALPDVPVAGTSRGVDFAGTGQATTGDPQLSGKSFTLELWAKRHAAGQLSPFITQGTNGLFFGLGPDDKVRFGFAGPAVETLVSSANYTDTGWHHWVATYDVASAARKIYRDGILLASDTAPSAFAGKGILRLGGDASGNHLNGAAQEIRLWRGERLLDDLLRWRTSSLIAASEPGLLGYWRADEANWPRLENLGSAGDALDGTLVGTLARVENLQNLNLVLIPEKATDYPVALPAFNTDTSGESGLTYEIVSQPSAGSLSSPDSGKVVYRPRSGSAGSDSFTYRVVNSGRISETVQVNLQILVVNDPPAISSIPNQILYETAGTLSVPFTLADEDTAIGSVSVSVSSSDTAALPQSAITVGGAGSNRTVDIAAQPGVFATSTVTLTATDGSSSTQRSFTVQMAPALAYRVIAIPTVVGTQVTQPRVISADGRIGGFGDTASGGVPRAFVNLGYVNNFGLQSGVLEQNNGRVNGLAVAGGLRVAVGEYLINGEWHAFLHNGATLVDLGKPAGSSGGYATAVNSSLRVVGYGVSGQTEKAFVSTGNPDAFTDIVPPGATTSRAVAINDAGSILLRTGGAGAFKAWVRDSGGGFTDLGVPAGHTSPIPLSINEDGAVLAEVTTVTGGRAIARHSNGTSSGSWVLLNDSEARWGFLGGGQMNTFGLVVSSGRQFAASASTAVLNSQGRWHRLNDLIPADSGWNLETAVGINRDGMIIGTGRLNGVPSAYLAVPANVIGQRIPRPQGSVARYPTIEILEGGVNDDDVSSFFWSELEKSLYAIRPVTARIKWFTTTDLAATDSPTITSFAANIWPRNPYIHVAGVPVDTEPTTTGTYRFALLAYSTDREAQVDLSTKKFNSFVTNGSVYSVMHLLRTEGRAPDPLYQTNAFLVVRTVPWYAAPLASQESVLVGATLTNALHRDYPGRNGYLVDTNSLVDLVGDDPAYKQSDRSGALNVVNTLVNVRRVNPSAVAPTVVWYDMTPYGLSLPNRPVTYQVSWPTNAPKVIVASTRGSNHDEADPITAARYPSARLYVQADRSLPGFNPNEEHALLAPSSQGQAVYAIRNDLNAFRQYSEPFCLLKYKDAATDEWRLKAYQVVLEQAPWFLRFGGDAGKEIQPPMPLSLLPLSRRSYVSSGDWFKDYNGKIYGRGAGVNGGTSDLIIRWFYPLQPGFDYDLNGDGTQDLPVGSDLPWLAFPTRPVNGDGTRGIPVPTVYTLRWPEVPVLQAGQTLTTPVSGLPDIRNMASAQIIYDSIDPTGMNWTSGLARIFDPISERHVALGRGFIIPSSVRTATDPRGRQIFIDLPYAIRIRLSYDPVNKWLYFGGYEDRTGIGEPLVLPNIMTGAERDVVKALAESSSATQKAPFEQAVDDLYSLCRNPNQIDLGGRRNPDGSQAPDGIVDNELILGLKSGTNLALVWNGVSRADFLAGNYQGNFRSYTNLVPEILGSGPKALTAADSTAPPALADPGKSLVFPANVSQYLRIDQPRGVAVSGTVSGLRGSFTIEFWIKPGAESTATNTLVRLGSNPLKALRAGYRSGYFTFEFNTQRVRTEDPVFASDVGGWQHYALVYDADSQAASIYRNGVAVGYAEGFSLPLDPRETASLYLGGDPMSVGQRFVGRIDEIRLWDGVARDGSQLEAKARKKLNIGQDGLAGYWRFDSAVGTRVPDDSGRGLHGVLAMTGVYETPADAPYGIPPRYITVVENNDPALGGLPVSLKIIEIDGGPYLGDLKVLPSDNVFDSRLILRHSSDFAGRTDEVEFEWWYHPYDAIARTNLPVVNPLTGAVSDTRGWIRHSGGKGLNQITLGGAGESGLLVLSDNWFIVRYKGFNVNGRTNWTSWIGDPSNKSMPAAMLAEGWVKRVIRGLNPFDARSTDFNSAQASTVISMLQQAGARYEGDIAFNPDPNYLNSVGLIEAYQTVLNRGISLSIEGVPAVNYGPANDALLMAASRIADLYTLLGNEAVADAADPTIGFTTSSSEYGATASSIFAFQNQLDSLLEEELSLLRGRDDSSAGVQGAPVYNRLLWNFTMGDGEVAYSQVYNMGDQNQDGKIDEKDARVLYPQGHGDAWGHYLTASKGYYQLLRHRNFTWQPRSESVLLAGVPVKVDYLDERKFATVAANKAKTGAEIVDLTYRQKYVADASGQWQGYTDTDTDRAWGVSDWAQRAGSASYFDWVTANAILPSTDPDPAHTGLDKIDRQSVDELAQIGSEALSIVAQVDKADNGLNPLGLVAGAVPFDLDPAQVSAGKTHFEQVAERARTALLNAQTLFNEANSMTVALRQSADSQGDLTDKNRKQERDLENQLIEIFGYPYAGDIGAGKTYPSGYSGPDLIHYLYVDTADVNGDTAPPDARVTAYHKTLNEKWVETTGVFEKPKFGPLAVDFNPVDHAVGIVSLEMVQRKYDTAAKIAGEAPQGSIRSVPGPSIILLRRRGMRSRPPRNGANDGPLGRSRWPSSN